MKNIDIAMATYNGELYLRDQLNSILNQTYSNWVLYISDDCSSDDTLLIINEFMKLDSRIKLVNKDRQGGVVKNFNLVLSSTTSDYIVLCDQDDVWPYNRLELLLEVILKKENGNSLMPILIYSDMELVTSELDIINESFFKENKLNPLDNISKNNIIWFSTVYGCTTIMNRSLLKLSLPMPDYAQMHDHWLAINAYYNGLLYYYDYKSVKYRQHLNNVVGGYSSGFLSKILNFKRKMKRINEDSVNTITLIKKYDFENLSFNSNKKIIFFALSNIFPKIFCGNKKIYSFLFFIFFICNVKR